MSRLFSDISHSAVGGSIPFTGDYMNRTIFIVLCVVVVIAIVAIVFALVKRKKDAPKGKHDKR